MKPPTPQREFKRFIGVVDYYRNTRPRRSHPLLPITRMKSNKRKFVEAKFEQDYLDKIKRTVVHNTLLTYPNFNEI